MQSRRSYGRFSDVAILNKKNGSQMLELGAGMRAKNEQDKKLSRSFPTLSQAFGACLQGVHVVASL